MLLTKPVAGWNSLTKKIKLNGELRNKMKIIFIGTPEFGVIVLNKLLEANLAPVLVITSPDKPVGRKKEITPPPVKLLAQKYNIPVEQPEKIQDTQYKIQDTNPDLIIVAAYGEILPKEILNIPRYGCLNIHPSLLPKYRGPSPIQRAILNGDKETGVTIILMDEKMDHGPILAQKELKIEEEETTETLHDKLAGLGASLLLATIPKWQKGGIKPEVQNEKEATFTKILTKEDGKINWQKPAQTIFQEIKAFYPWPGSYTFWQKKERLIKIKIIKARVFKSPDASSFPIAKVLIVPQNEIGIQCGEKSFLAVERLQMEGKKAMSSEDFLRGHADFIGAVLS
ncbi:MAG: methionyl-tRNA formyltransferase [bacterium]